MAQISINLLPLELKVNQREVTRKKIITKLSIALSAISIFAAIVILVAGLTIKIDVQNKSKEADDLLQQIKQFQEAEGRVTILKSRLGLIDTILSKESPQTQAFNLTTILIPPDVQLNNFAVDKSGSVKISAQAKDLKALKNFFDNVTNPEIHDGKILSATVDALSQNNSQIITVEISLHLKPDQVKIPAKS